MPKARNFPRHWLRLGLWLNTTYVPRPEARNSGAVLRETRRETPRAVHDEIIIRVKVRGLFLVTKKMNKNTLQGTVAGEGSEATAIPYKTVVDRTDEILTLCKTLSTYVNKVFSAVLRLEYELTNEEARK